ncbi:MAG TPA: hypothetical protein VEV41_01815 [Terriglobales bacterium]|nr:hypothetical protein [Terriglobales bacterium]
MSRTVSSRPSLAEWKQLELLHGRMVGEINANELCLLLRGVALDIALADEAAGELLGRATATRTSSTPFGFNSGPASIEDMVLAAITVAGTSTSSSSRGTIRTSTLSVRRGPRRQRDSYTGHRIGTAQPSA